MTAIFDVLKRNIITHLGIKCFIVVDVLGVLELPRLLRTAQFVDFGKLCLIVLFIFGKLAFILLFCLFPFQHRTVFDGGVILFIKVRIEVGFPLCH